MTEFKEGGKKRICKSLGEEAVKNLQDLSNSDLKSLLMMIYAERARLIRVKHVKSSFKQRNASRVSGVSPQVLHQIEGVFFDNISEEIEAIDLSPITPFGTNKSLCAISQNTILSAMGWAEVLADPTTALAYGAVAR